MREHDFDTTPNGCVRTATGIIIGGAWRNRPEPNSLDADLIQTALLRRRAPQMVERLLDAFDAAPVPVIVGILIVGVAAGLVRWLP